jgi:hypothetical protein
MLSFSWVDWTFLLMGVCGTVNHVALFWPCRFPLMSLFPGLSATHSLGQCRDVVKTINSKYHKIELEITIGFLQNSQRVLKLKQITEVRQGEVGDNINTRK